MRFFLVLSALVVGGGCVPDEDLGFPVDAPNYLVVELRDGPPVTATARVFVRGDESKPLILSYVAQSTVYVLGYDAALGELAIEADADGQVPVAAEDAPAHLAWSIPTPKGWAQLDMARGGELVAEGGPSLPPALGRVLLARPACPVIRQERSALDLPVGATSMVRFGPQELLLGRARKDEDDLPLEAVPAIFRVARGSEPRLVAPPEEMTLTSTTHYLLDVLFYRDDDRLRVVFGSNQTKIGWTYAVTGAEPTFSDRQPLARADDEQPIPSALAAQTFSSTRTVVMIGAEWRYFAEVDDFSYVPQLLAQDSPPRGLWFRKAEQPVRADDCDAGTSTNLLVITGPGTGIVALKRDRFRMFDLADPRVLGAPYGPESAGLTCRSSRAVMASGDELLSWSGIPTQDLGVPNGWVAWRRTGDDGWQILPSSERRPTGAAMVALGELVFVAAGDRVAVYQRDRRRPELPPRYCGDQSVRANSQVMAATDEAVLVGGPGGELVWLVPEL